jgi:hypothetical protein
VLFSSEISQFPEQIGSLYLSGAFSSPKFLNEATTQGGNIGRTASCNEIKDHKVTIHLRSPLLLCCFSFRCCLWELWFATIHRVPSCHLVSTTSPNFPRLVSKMTTYKFENSCKPLSFNCVRTFAFSTAYSSGLHPSTLVKCACP